MHQECPFVRKLMRVIRKLNNPNATLLVKPNTRVSKQELFEAVGLSVYEKETKESLLDKVESSVDSRVFDRDQKVTVEFFFVMNGNYTDLKKTATVQFIVEKEEKETLPVVAEVKPTNEPFIIGESLLNELQNTASDGQPEEPLPAQPEEDDYSETEEELYGPVRKLIPVPNEDGSFDKDRLQFVFNKELGLKPGRYPIPGINARIKGVEGRIVKQLLVDVYPVSLDGKPVETINLTKNSVPELSSDGLLSWSFYDQRKEFQFSNPHAVGVNPARVMQGVVYLVDVILEPEPEPQPEQEADDWGAFVSTDTVSFNSQLVPEENNDWGEFDQTVVAETVETVESPQSQTEHTEQTEPQTDYHSDYYYNNDYYSNPDYGYQEPIVEEKPKQTEEELFGDLSFDDDTVKRVNDTFVQVPARTAVHKTIQLDDYETEEEPEEKDDELLDELEDEDDFDSFELAPKKEKKGLFKKGQKNDSLKEKGKVVKPSKKDRVAREKNDSPSKKTGGFSKLIAIATGSLVVLVGGGYTGWSYLVAKDAEPVIQKLSENNEKVKAVLNKNDGLTYEERKEVQALLVDSNKVRESLPNYKANSLFVKSKLTTVVEETNKLMDNYAEVLKN